jgi:hypothetical protein
LFKDGHTPLQHPPIPPSPRPPRKDRHTTIDTHLSLTCLIPPSPSPQPPRKDRDPPPDRSPFHLDTALPLVRAAAALRSAAAPAAAGRLAIEALAGAERERLQERLAEVGKEGLPPRAGTLLFELPVRRRVDWTRGKGQGGCEEGGAQGGPRGRGAGGEGSVGMVKRGNPWGRGGFFCHMGPWAGRIGCAPP